MTARASCTFDQGLGEFDAEVAAALDGRQGEDRLHRIGITVNRNAVPFDPRPPMVGSGLRIGTLALATLGFDSEDFLEVAAALKPGPVEDKPRARVAVLTERHPLYATRRAFGARS